MPILLLGAAGGALVTWWATGTTEKLVKAGLVLGAGYVGYRVVSGYLSK